MTNAKHTIDRNDDAGRGQTVPYLLSPIVQMEKEWSEAGIGNAFIFGKVMSSRQDLFLELLQISLPEMHIQAIEEVGREVDIRLAIDAHGIRMDVSATDDHGRRIDVEMQMRDEKNIPRRIRYYIGAIDQTLLEQGRNYSELTETVIVFITPFDPFGQELLRYTFRSFCVEDKQIELQDGTTRVVLNAAGTKGDISDDLKEFLKLVTGIMPSKNSSFAGRVQEQVLIARQNSKWRREYMDWKMTLLNERTKGREEGMEIGALRERIETVAKKVKKGLGLPEIADAMELEEEAVLPILEAVKKAAPEYDTDRILKTLLEH